MTLAGRGLALTALLAVVAAEATIRAIHEAAARRGHEVAVREASANARERFADVLRRLGERPTS